MCCRDLTITGTLTADSLNLSTANLIPGDNIQIVDDVISAFLGANSIVNINSLHSDGNVDVVGALNVCQTSTFGGALHVSYTIYSGVVGQHEGSLVLYSNVVGNNFAQTYNANGDEVNIIATGTATAINYFVGGNHVLRLTQNAFQVDEIDATTIDTNELLANVFTCRDGKATFRFNTPTLNASTINTSSINMCDITGTNVCVTGNMSCLNFSADLAIIEDVVVTDTFECNTIDTISISATTGDIDNFSCDNLSAIVVEGATSVNTAFLNATNCSVGDISANGLIECQEMNISETLNAVTCNFSNVSAGNISTGKYRPLNGAVNSWLIP
jgi:hypothetical protein